MRPRLVDMEGTRSSDPLLIGFGPHRHREALYLQTVPARQAPSGSNRRRLPACPSLKSLLAGDTPASDRFEYPADASSRAQRVDCLAPGVVANVELSHTRYLCRRYKEPVQLTKQPGHGGYYRRKWRHVLAPAPSLNIKSAPTLWGIRRPAA